MARIPLAIALLTLPLLLVSASADVQERGEARDWSGLEPGDVVRADAYDASAGTCVADPATGIVRITFSDEETRSHQEMARESGKRPVTVKTLEIASTADSPCTFVVAEKTQRSWLCPLDAKGVPDDLEKACEPADARAGPRTVIDPIEGVSVSTYTVEGRYRVKACCYDWWLTYQKSVLDYSADQTQATYLSGAFLCDGNGRHSFAATQCDYDDWVTGPGPEVGFQSEGHFVQIGGPFNYLKTVRVEGYAGGGNGCEFDIGGVYPWDANGSRHKKQCISSPDEDDAAEEIGDFMGDFENILN